jgi:hypothetical protein
MPSTPGRSLEVLIKGSMRSGYFVILKHYGKNWLMRIGQMEQHQLNTYACFEKITVFLITSQTISP